MNGTYTIDISDIIDSLYDDVIDDVCNGCPNIKLYHSGRNSFGEQIDPPEYTCPLDFEPDLDYEIDDNTITVSCQSRNIDES